MTNPASQPEKLPPRPLTRAQRGCLGGCLIVAVLGAAGMIGLGWWVRESLRKDPQAAAGLLASGEPESPVVAQPGGLARRLDVDLLMASDAAWSPDGRTVALCGVPGMSLRTLMPSQQVAPFDFPKAQEEAQRRVREAMVNHVFLVDTTTGASRTLPSPEEGSYVETVTWWPDGRLLEFTRPTVLPTEDKPSDTYGARRLWLVNPADDRAEKVAEFKGYPYLYPGPRGVAFVMDSGEDKYQPYVLVPSAEGPALKQLSAKPEYSFAWDSHGGLYSWGAGAKGTRWALWKVALPSAAVSPVPVRELSGRSITALSADEMGTLNSFPPGSKTRAFYALDVTTGIARRLSEALPDTISSVHARLLGGRWILVEQERYRNSQWVHRLYGYCIPEGRFYLVTDWGPLESLVPRHSARTDGDLLLLQKSVRPENFLRLFTGGLGSETWLLRLDERQLLSQAPTGADEWTIKAGEACPTGG